MSTALEPVNAESEVLAALLVNEQALAVVRPILRTPACFSVPLHAKVYAAILLLSDRDAPIDHVTLADELRAAGVEDPGLLLEDLVTFPGFNFEHHALSVLDAHRRRMAKVEAHRILSLAEDRTVPLDRILADSSARLVAVAVDGKAPQDKTLASTLWQVMENLEARVKSGIEIAGVASGYPKLDRHYDGFCPGELTILAARPSQGKTSFSLRVARHAADVGPVVYYSIEMSRVKLAERLLSAEAGCNMRWCTTTGDRTYFDKHASNIARGAGALAKVPFFVNDEENQTPGGIRLDLQARIAQGTTPALVIIDYLGLMAPDVKQENRNNDLGMISKGLKGIAKHFQLPVVCLHQLNRASAMENRAPQLHDLRDSGNIEQDADNVLMLHWPEGKPEHGAIPVDLYIRKARNGETGMVPLLFEHWNQRWIEPNASHSQELSLPGAA